MRRSIQAFFDQFVIGSEVVYFESNQQRSFLFYTVAFLFLVGKTLRDIMILRQ